MVSGETLLNLYRFMKIIWGFGCVHFERHIDGQPMIFFNIQDIIEEQYPLFVGRLLVPRIA